MEQVALNKSRSLLVNILQSRQTLGLFTINIKTESIYKSCQNSWVEEHRGSLRGGSETQALKVRVAEFA